MPGPCPKSPLTRRSRQKTSTRTTIDGVPPVQPVPLPVRADHAGAWHPLTVQMWATIWASPLVGEYVEADLPGLYRLAQLDHDFWSATSAADRAKVAGAINAVSRNYGLDPMSRRSLQWEVKRATPAAPPPTQAPTAVRDPRLQLVPRPATPKRRATAPP